MRRSKKILVCMSLVLLVACSTLQAQNEYPRVNTNLGAAIGVPLNPTGRFVDLGAGFTAGAGYNFNRHHSLIAEFMWNHLPVSDGALRPIQLTLQDNTISGHSNVYAITGNYRFQVQGKVLGAYFIGGGGWYHRTLSFSKEVTSGTSTTCTSAWLWWGFNCVGGTVLANETIRSSKSDAIGGNGGIGFTAKVADPDYRIYVESRYHYAPHTNVNTQLVSITVGIRY